MTARHPRFLILRGGAIGDFILTLPVLQALRRQWPEAWIELIGYPHIAALGVAGGLVDRVVSLDKAEMARFFVPHAALRQEQREYIRSFDVVLSYLYDPEDLVRANLLSAGARQVLCGSPVVEEGHAADYLARPLATLAIFEEDARPALILSGEKVAEGRAWLAARRLHAPLALHPGSGGREKNWPLDSFLALARQADAGGEHAVLFVAGEADAEIVARLGSRYPVAANESLVSLAGILSGCGGFVGNDSGITHLAAALGLPVLALFGPTNPDSWGPRGDRVVVLRAPSGRMDQLAFDDVAAALQALLT